MTIGTFKSLRHLFPPLIIAIVSLSILASGCGDDDDEREVGGGLEHDVHVHLDEWSVEVDPSAIEDPGSITIGGHNHGTLPHQITIIKTELDPSELPQGPVSVDIEAAGDQIISFDVPPADGDEGLQVVVATLDPGKYAIICNIPGHYQQGMYAGLEVTESPES